MLSNVTTWKLFQLICSVVIIYLQNLLEGSTATSYKDLMMLKVIFCSALYPQIAIPDEFNTSKVEKKTAILKIMF